MSQNENWQDQPTTQSAPDHTKIDPNAYGQQGQPQAPYGQPAPGQQGPYGQPQGQSTPGQYGQPQQQYGQYPSVPGAGAPGQGAAQFGAPQQQAPGAAGYPSAPQPGGYQSQQPYSRPDASASGQGGYNPGGYQGGYPSAPQYGQAPQAPQPGYGQPQQGYPSNPQQGFNQPPQQGYQAAPASSWQQVNPTNPAGSSAATAGGSSLGRKLGWGVLAMALLAIVGVFGPWVSVHFDMGSLGSSDGSINGIGMTSGDGSGDERSEAVKDGWFILVFALLALALGVLRGLGKIKPVLMFAAVALGVIGLGVCLYDWMDLSGEASDLKDAMSSLGGDSSLDIGAGWGLILSTVSCLGVAALAAVSATGKE